MMDYEEIRIAIVAQGTESARILPRLHACGVAAEAILCVEPHRWPELWEDSIGLCFWVPSEDVSVEHPFPDLRRSPAMIGQCLNVSIEAGQDTSHSPYVMRREEFDDPQVTHKLQHLIEEAQVRRNLDQHQQWYRVAVAEGDIGLWWWDRQIDFVYLSQHFQKMLRLKPNALPQNVNQWLSLIHPDDRFSLTQTISAQFHPESERFQLECRIRHADGHYRWYTLSGQRQTGPQDRDRVLGAAIDITDRKEAELALAMANQLAKSAVHAKSEFLTNMSHNLRTPLTAILGHADLLDQNKLDDQAADSLASIRRNGRQLMQLLDDILELSCIESTQPTLHMAKTDIADILGDLPEVYRTQANQKGLDLQVHLMPDIPTELVTDAACTRQILTRLVENALKFTPEGEVTLEASFHRFPQPTLQWIVRDSGVGIPASRLETIFEPFTQADNSPSRRHDGPGLGLSICQRLVKTLRGTLDVESEVGNGTSFLLRIPVEVTSLSQDAPIASPKSPEPQPPVRLDGYRVLLVEDGGDNQVVLSAFLRSAGATVALANNGLEAVEWVSANRRDAGTTGYDSDPRVDVILMDMQMPVMDGYQATRLLRESGFVKPILAITAHALQGDRGRCLDAGCDDYFTKPVKRQPFLAFVKRYGKHSQYLATT